MKKLIFAVLSILFLLFPSCGAQTYRNDFSAEELCKKCAEAMEIEEPETEGAEAFPEENRPGLAPEVAVCYSANGSNLDEIGIWKATGEKPRQVATFVANSLFDRYLENEAFYQSYLPEEAPKLRDTEVRVYGNYVVYAALSPERKKAFFQFLEKTLAKAEQPAVQAGCLIYFSNSFSTAAMRTQTVSTCIAW